MLADRIKFVKKSIIREIYDNAKEGAINLGLGEIQFETPNLIRMAGKQAINQGELFYTANAGLINLRKLIAVKYNTAYSNVCVTNGAQEAIFAVLYSLINPGDLVLIADPTFLAYKTIAEMLGGKIITFDTDQENNFNINWTSLEQALALKPKVLFLNHPSNPTGRAFNQDEINKISQLCKSHQVLLIVDEVYLEVGLDKAIPSFWNGEDHIIVISGLSKSHCMTGWRLGWISAHEPLINSFIIAHQYISTCASVVSQKAAIRALSEKGSLANEKLRKSLRKNYLFSLYLLKKKLPAEDIIIPESAPYLFVNIHREDLQFCKDLAQKGVIIIPGSAFGNKGKQFVRINYALTPKRLRIGLNRFLKYL